MRMWQSCVSCCSVCVPNKTLSCFTQVLLQSAEEATALPVRLVRLHKISGYEVVCLGCRAQEDSDSHGLRMLKMSTRRRTESEQLLPDLDKEAADEQDIAAMAKVWAHPEDLHLYQVKFSCSL